MSIPILVLGLALGAIVIAGASTEGSKSPRSLIRPCPEKPNCVSSRAPEGPRRMHPVRYQGSLEEAQERLLAVIRSFRQATVVQNDGIYLKVEFRSAIFSFVDDVEFEFDDAAKQIHFRSASRLGYYDFGINRRRMEAFIQKFSAK